jgi:hypothetical protein
MQIEDQENIEEQIFDYVLGDLDFSSEDDNMSIVKKSKKSNTMINEDDENINTLFKVSPNNSSFIVLIKRIETIWEDIYKQPCQKISSLFKVEQTILLSSMQVGNHLLDTSP